MANKINYTIRKVRGKDCYCVRNKITKKVYAKCTTREKAARQVKLLISLQTNPDFVPNSRKKESIK